MSDLKPTIQASTAVPTGASVTKNPQYHWWYDAKAAGVRNSPPSGMAASPPTSFGYLSQSPNASAISGIAIPRRERKDSLKHLVHLCDFATP